MRNIWMLVFHLALIDCSQEKFKKIPLRRYLVTQTWQSSSSLSDAGSCFHTADRSSEIENLQRKQLVKMFGKFDAIAQDKAVWFVLELRLPIMMSRLCLQRASRQSADSIDDLRICYSSQRLEFGHEHCRAQIGRRFHQIQKFNRSMIHCMDFRDSHGYVPNEGWRNITVDAFVWTLVIYREFVGTEVDVGLMLADVVFEHYTPHLPIRSRTVQYSAMSSSEHHSCFKKRTPLQEYKSIGTPNFIRTNLDERAPGGFHWFVFDLKAARNLQYVYLNGSDGQKSIRKNLLQFSYQSSAGRNSSGRDLCCFQTRRHEEEDDIISNRTKKCTLINLSEMAQTHYFAIIFQRRINISRFFIQMKNVSNINMEVFYSSSKLRFGEHCRNRIFESSIQKMIRDGSLKNCKTTVRESSANALNINKNEKFNYFTVDCSAALLSAVFKFNRISKAGPIFITDIRYVLKADSSEKSNYNRKKTLDSIETFSATRRFDLTNSPCSAAYIDSAFEKIQKDSNTEKVRYKMCGTSSMNGLKIGDPALVQCNQKEAISIILRKRVTNKNGRLELEDLSIISTSSPQSHMQTIIFSIVCAIVIVTLVIFGVKYVCKATLYFRQQLLEHKKLDLTKRKLKMMEQKKMNREKHEAAGKVDINEDNLGDLKDEDLENLDADLH